VFLIDGGAGSVSMVTVMGMSCSWDKVYRWCLAKTRASAMGLSRGWLVGNPKNFEGSEPAP